MDTRGTNVVTCSRCGTTIERGRIFCPVCQSVLHASHDPEWKRLRDIYATWSYDAILEAATEARDQYTPLALSCIDEELASRERLALPEDADTEPDDQGLTPRERAEKKWKSLDLRLRARTRKAWITRLLIGINILVFAVAVYLRGGASIFDPDTWQAIESAWHRLALWTLPVIQGEWWRLVTALFLHRNAGHLFHNLILLWCMGRELERLVGSTWFLVVYLASGVTGAVASLVWAPFAMHAGASGAVSGVIGAIFTVLLMQPAIRLSDLVRARRFFSLVLFILIADSVAPFAGRWYEETPSLAHGVGFATGLLIGAALPLTVAARGNRRQWNSVRVCTAAAVAISLGATGLVFEYSHSYLFQFVLAMRTFDKGRGDEGIRRMEAIASGHDDPVLHYALGNAYMAGRPRDPQKAVFEFERCLSSSPANVACRLELAKAYSLLSRWDEAADQLESAWNLRPQDQSLKVRLVTALKIKAALLTADRRFDDAVSVLQRAQLLLPSDMEIRAALARTYYAAGDTEHARQALSEAERIDTMSGELKEVRELLRKPAERLSRPSPSPVK